MAQLGHSLIPLDSIKHAVNSNNNNNNNNNNGFFTNHKLAAEGE